MENSNLTKASQKLLYCKITSKDFSQSERLVELENFQLWAYMMFHKHGLRIQDISLWLWVEEKDYLEREQLYEHAPDIMEVSKLGVFLFDEQNGFSHVSYRYTTKNQVSKVKEILLSHISKELVAEGNYELTVETGYCIKNDIKNLGKLVLGLSDKDEKSWYRGR
jgi:hypothetical protein